MSDPRPQLALREWRRHLLHPLTLTALTAVSAVLCLIGPFGTLSSLSLVPRIAYWTLLTFAGYTTGYLVSYAVLRPSQSGVAHLMRIQVAGGLTGCAMIGLVTVLNWLVFGAAPFGDGTLTLAGTTLVISVIVMVVLDLFTRHLSPAPANVPQTVPLLDRLPLDKRGRLIAISVEDHYVRVRTTKGEEMILMRLADAIREVGATPGAQVHRSHWAAFDQVNAVTRDSDRAVLQMTNGGDIPVSRRHIPTIKEAGLLPR
ncbi:LytTR family DNA-binding domain-containing protein [Marivita sp.]|uniref:LytTR family DNA-binding domain-containing protein n=1 Tax=Marivita sp. TaxID=2003365 RepID=UPI00261268A2|nr:LytTR family DNA-binding domain-containing protein [Marivita sp.]